MKKWMKIVKCPEEFGSLTKGVRKTIKNEAKKQKGGFIGMLLGALGAALLLFKTARIYTKCLWTSYIKKEIMQKFNETGDLQYIYRNEPDKACFQHVMAYGDFVDLTRRTASDKILRDKAFDIAKKCKLWWTSTWTCFSSQ